MVQRQFWRLIATGVTSAQAAVTVGVSVPVGSRWFRHAGGMPPISLVEPTARYLRFQEREEIALLRAKGVGVRAIARALGRDPGTISRELRRNAATRGGTHEYRATVAQWKAQQAARRPKVTKLAADARLRVYVQERLDGSVRRADGTAVAGPDAAGWKGRKMKPHRADRRWATAWSPQQISHRLRLDFPDDESMRISHEAIYQALFIEGRGALKRELVACLRTGRALREPRARTRNKPQGHVGADVVLSQRPAEAADRAAPGHWEGDLIIGTGRSAIGTLVERSSRATILVHLPRQEGWGEQPVVKNGPSLGGYGVVAMNAALAASFASLPLQLRQTLTWDRGGELAGHAAHPRDRHEGLLRRPALALAAAHEREHQRAASPVLPQGHRPVAVERRGPRGRRTDGQQPTPQGPRLEDPRRGLHRTATLARTIRCCTDRLNPPSSVPGRSPGELATRA